MSARTVVRVKRSAIATGDRVRYSAKFLRSVGLFTGPIPFAIGTVENLAPFGSPGRYLATVKWDNDANGELPSRILSVNLVCVGRPEAD